MTNIYKINDTDLEEFLAYRSTIKVVLYYKQECEFCKAQIVDLNNLANTYHEGIEYALCDIARKTKFCLKNNITSIPTIQIYENNKLVKQFEAYQPYSELEKAISLSY